MLLGPINEEKVEISGDGAKMSRIANFIVLSFSLLSDGESVMSASGKQKSPSCCYYCFSCYCCFLSFGLDERERS